jgi:hypothetical protein
MAFIYKEIEPQFFSSLLLCLNHLRLEFTKNLRPKPISGMRNILAGMFFRGRSDKLDCLIHTKKNYLQFTTAYYSYEGHDPWHTRYEIKRKEIIFYLQRWIRLRQRQNQF